MIPLSLFPRFALSMDVDGSVFDISLHLFFQIFYFSRFDSF